MARHDPYAAFRIRSYRRFMLGWLAAVIGTQIQSIAIQWEIYERTGSAASLAVVGLVQAIPAMSLAIPAGYLADHFPRRNLVMLSLIGATLTSVTLGIMSLYEGPVWAMVAVLLLDSTMLTLGRPARTAFMPQLVPPEVFPNAVTWNSSMWQISSVVGPALGGVVVAYSVPAAYFIAASTTTVFAIWMLTIHPQYGSQKKTPLSLSSLSEGLRFMNRNRVVLMAISLDMFAVLLGGVEYLLPIFAEDILKVDSRGFGLLRAAPAVGALLTGIAITHLPPMQKAGRTMLLAVVGFGAAVIVFGLSNNFYLSLAMLLVTGMMDNISVVVRHTLIQLSTPDSMRGRVSAVNTVFISASNELGGAVSGGAAAWLGPVAAAVAGGIGTIMSVVAVAWASPELRRFGALHDARAEEDDDEPKKDA